MPENASKHAITLTNMANNDKSVTIVGDSVLCDAVTGKPLSIGDQGCHLTVVRAEEVFAPPEQGANCGWSGAGIIARSGGKAIFFNNDMVDMLERVLTELKNNIKYKASQAARETN